MNTPLKLTYLRQAFNSEAHPEVKDAEAKYSCPGCIWAVDDNGEEFLLWKLISPTPSTYTIHRLDHRYPTRTDYGDIEVVGLEKNHDDICTACGLRRVAWMRCGRATCPSEPTKL